jgi:DNA ligase (NAD+)
LDKDKISFKRLDETKDNLQYIAQDLSYPIDGVVFKMNNLEEGAAAGETSHHFKNALAFKFYDETYHTKLLNIEYDVSRNGILTPVVVFEPINIEGSEITRASLHNLSVMTETLGETIFKGQPLEIFRANMIIPQVYSAIKKEDYQYPISNEDVIELPRICPICGRELNISESDTGILTLTCINLACEGRLVNRLDHFCGKKGLDIKGLSIATLNKLIDWGWVSGIEDIFNLKKYQQEWMQMEGFGEKSVTNILNSIEKSKNCSLTSFLAAIGIPFVGTSVAKELAANVIDYPDFRDRVYEGWNFASIPNFGQVKMDAILTFNYDEADSIYHLLNITNEKEEKTISLQGITFVVTGKLNTFKNRAMLKEEIEKRGGKVTDSVTSKTTYLINNDKESTSTKNKKTQELGVKIISEADFLELIKYKIFGKIKI